MSGYITAYIVSLIETTKSVWQLKHILVQIQTDMPLKKIIIGQLYLVFLHVALRYKHLKSFINEDTLLETSTNFFPYPLLFVCTLNLLIGDCTAFCQFVKPWNFCCVSSSTCALLHAEEAISYIFRAQLQHF
ncbi:hypothetical protein WA026_000589 [Henosepilachna vigintioctopunctata]|uniref:Uncharacterized protein n=1 Tax=Henosepilachna vigintioctopunctata TaxID=420089 RepID=A0AAW1V6J9_9CUCU